MQVAGRGSERIGQREGLQNHHNLWLRKYEELINWLTSSMIASASSGEATNKEIKQAWGHTNKQGEAAMQQVCHAGQPAGV